MQEQRVETVGLREFRANLHRYTSGFGHPLLITSHGHNVGFYIPIHKAPEEKQFEALRRASDEIVEMLEQHGITTEQFIEEFKARRVADSGSQE